MSQTNKDIIMCKKFIAEIGCKRIISEVEELQKLYSSVSVLYNSIFEKLSVIISDDPNKIIEFIINEEHPFKKPVVLINSEIYKNYLVFHDNTSSDIQKNKLGINKCLLCDSCINNNNWSPVIRLNNVLEEIKDNFEILERIKKVKKQSNNYN